MSSRSKWLAAEVDDGMRVDAFLAQVWNVSAAEARRRCADGVIRIDGRRVQKGQRISPGDAIEFEAARVANLDDVASGAVRAAIRVALLPDTDVKLAELFVDEFLVAVDKPAGIPSHPLRFAERGTAANGIVARFPECADASADPREGGLCHRLDAGTSGVLIAARSRAAWERLRAAVAGEGCEKQYLAEVNGHPPGQGVIAAPIGRSGRRGATVRVEGGRQPLPAETSWKVLAQGGDSALVLAWLHRGRPHQVRAHLSAAGFPIVGDEQYGAPALVSHSTATAAAVAATTATATVSALGPASSAPPSSGFRLHALTVRMKHPFSGATLSIVAPAPSWARWAKFTE